MDTSVPELPVKREELEDALERCYEGGRSDRLMIMAEDQHHTLVRWRDRMEELLGVVDELKEETRRLHKENERLRSKNEAIDPIM